MKKEYNHTGHPSISTDEYKVVERNLDLVIKKENLKERKCPECGKEMLFYIKGSFVGTLGVFECKCGYKSQSSSNISYATNEEWERFRKNTKSVRW